jgi:outer membrane protein
MKSSILLTIGLLSAITLSAQNNELTFSDAVTIGLSDNVVMKNTRNSLRSFKTDKAFQIMSFTPNLGISSGASQTSGPQVDPEKGLINATTSNFRASIGSNLVLYSGNNRIHALKSSAYQLQGQELLIKRTEQDIINFVALQFLQVLLDQELLVISEQNLVTQQRTLAEINGFVEAGSRPEVDKYRQDADVKRFELLVIQAKNNLSNDKADLAQLLQLDPANDFVVVRPDWNIDLIRVLEYNLAELYATALSSRADYQRLEAVENASFHNFRGSFNGYVPFLSAFAQFGSTYFNDNDDATPTNSFSDQMSDRRSTSYGLNLTIPLWDRLQTRNNRVFNKVNYENSVNDVENLKITVKIEVQNAYNNFTDVKAGYAVSLAQHEAAKLAYETQQESYNVGLATQVELAIANEAYIGAQANLAQTGYRLLFQKILLDYATGVLTQESIDN